jgi:hypothetical protein
MSDSDTSDSQSAGSRGGDGGGGAGGGGGAAKKRRMSAVESWEKIKQLGWSRTGPADKSIWLGDSKRRVVWCVPCCKAISYGGTFSNITSHAEAEAHKANVSTAAKNKEQHPHVLAMLQSPVGVGGTSEEARMNARGIFALRALTLAPKVNLAELYRYRCNVTLKLIFSLSFR